MSEPVYAGVMFDLGGTLFHDLPAHISERNVRAVLGGMGIGVDQLPASAALIANLGNAREHVERNLRRAGFYTHAELVRAQFVDTVADLGLLVAPGAGEIAQAAERFFELQRRSVYTWLRPRADCHECLRRLRGLGCDVTIVSNNDQGYVDHLVHKWRLAPLLRGWLSSDAAGVCKPAPEIFHQGLAGSGLKPADVLYVGDSLVDDVGGARAAGMPVALFDTNSTHQQSGADYVIGTLSELPPLVAPGG